MLASSAFPLGLAPWLMEHVCEIPGSRDPYSCRRWSIPVDGMEEPDGGCFREEGDSGGFGSLGGGSSLSVLVRGRRLDEQ